MAQTQAQHQADAASAGIDHDQYHRGEMDIQEQATTYGGFMGLAKWGSLGVASLVLFLTLWFCTDAGFLAAFASAAVLVALGVFFLREKRTTQH